MRLPTVFGLFFLLLGLTGCFQWRYSDRKTMRLADSNALELRVRYAQYEDREMRYLEVGSDTTLPLIVFVHGAPGSSSTYRFFLQDSLLNTKARMLAVDRLGYGYSEFGQSETRLEEQATSLASIIRSHKKNQSLILVGHSFGGPIVSRMAAMFPELCEGVVLLAPAIDPDNEKIFWFSHLGKYPPSRWITPRALKVATDEKFTHEAELREMLPLWKQISDPVTYFHGDADKIVPYINMKFIEKQITGAPLKMITVPGEDHGLPYTQVPMIRDEILRMLEQ